MNILRLFFKYDYTCNRLEIVLQIDSLFSFVSHIHVWSQLFMSHLDAQHASKADNRISNGIHRHCLHHQESWNCTWTDFKDYRWFVPILYKTLSKLRLNTWEFFCALIWEYKWKDTWKSQIKKKPKQINLPCPEKVLCMYDVKGIWQYLS